MTCYLLYYAKRSKGQPVIAGPLILIDAYVYLLFPSEMVACDSFTGGKKHVCFLHSYIKSFFISHSIFSVCPYIFASNIFENVFSSFFAPLARLFLRVSAQCPVEEESRLGPSSVFGRVALQLAACPSRDLSLPGLATLSSAPLPPLSLHKALARPQY